MKRLSFNSCGTVNVFLYQPAEIRIPYSYLVKSFLILKIISKIENSDHNFRFDLSLEAL